MEFFCREEEDDDDVASPYERSIIIDGAEMNIPDCFSIFPRCNNFYYLQCPIEYWPDPRSTFINGWFSLKPPRLSPGTTSCSAEDWFHFPVNTLMHTTITPSTKRRIQTQEPKSSIPWINGQSCPCLLERQNILTTNLILFSKQISMNKSQNLQPFIHFC